MGADIVNSLDISKYQNADILFNLNCPDLPDELRNSFDCIFDGSTTEHIFDIHQVFKNLHQILTPGGVIFHLSPLEGLAHDSFYQFGLNFFSELYGVNGYEQIFHQIYVYDYEHLIYAPSKIEKAGTDWFFDDPVEGLNFARKNDLPAQHLFMAKKPKGQTKKLISPLQARYSQNTNWQKSLKKNSGL